MNQSSEQDARHEFVMVQAARRGDLPAFARLVETHQDRLYNSLVQITGCPAEAEDVAQDAFIQAYHKLSGFRGEASFFTWLYRIALNRALRIKQRSQNRTPSESLGEDDLVAPGNADTPGDRLLQDERARQIRTALNQLAPEFRTVIVLREVDGFDYHTIAETLGVSVGTVRSRLHRARSQLRAKLRTVLADRD